MSDYESWLVKREEKAERKNAVFWLIFSIIIIGIAMWCFVDTIREYQFSEKLLREGTCITAEYYEGHNAYQYFEAGKSRFAVCKKSIIYKDQGDTVKMYYTGDDFSQAVPLLADWVWITEFGIEIAVMGAGLIGVIRQGKRIHRNNLRKQSNRVKSESAFQEDIGSTGQPQGCGRKGGSYVWGIKWRRQHDGNTWFAI